jgi:hypothetical protein
MRKKLFVISILLITFLTNSYSQNLVVKSVSLQPTDQTAIKKPVVTANGDTCALIKIKLNLEGLQFTNNTQYVGDVKYENGEYLLYKSIYISKSISYQHPDYLPGVIDLSEYGYRKLKGGKTYLVTMEAPVAKIGKSIVAIKVQPTTANVSFDGKLADMSDDGIYEFPVGAGTYRYVVQSPDFISKSGAVTIEEDATKTLSVRLIPITHVIDVSCNISHAHVYVDNIDYGKVGKLSLPQGDHHVRVQADGFIDEERTVAINNSTQQITFQLKKNENRIDIHAIPITIISTSKNIYKNNKKLEGWTSGSPVKFMPGEYMLSTDGGKTKIIKVENTPFEVVL